MGLFAAAALLLIIPRAHAQYQPPSDFITIQGTRAYTWTEGNSNVVQVEGPVTIKTDRATLTADQAVLWITPTGGALADEMSAEVSLIGNARLVQGTTERSGNELFVSLPVRGSVSITTDDRRALDQHDSPTYRQALELRPLRAPGRGMTANQWLVQPAPEFEEPTSQPALSPSTRPTQPVTIQADSVKRTTTPEGKIALVLSGGVNVFYRTARNDFIEMRADRAVVFSQFATFKEITQSGKFTAPEDAVQAVYLEGDVRIARTPPDQTQPDQRLSAERAYYEVTTDRAVLTEAMIQTSEPKSQTPIIVRANLIRQLSLGEFKAEKVELTTSSFATPSYSVRADKAYVREAPTGDPRLGNRTEFFATNTTFNLFHVPFFYLPAVGGTVTDHGMPLREIRTGSRTGFGPNVRTEWGLFETLGKAPPKDLDASFHADYFGERGPGTGLDAKYQGGFVTETSKEPWNFQGDITSYIVHDQGVDKLGRSRADIEPEDELRYQFLWEHQHFFPEDWQVQIRAGVVSDPTFLEEWFENDFDNGLPHDLSLYLKRQRGTEAVTFLMQAQPNDFVTTADQLQENFEISRVPEIGYHRIGDSFADDSLTFFSSNTFSGLHFEESRASLGDLGFRTLSRGTPEKSDDIPVLPGIPAEGQTGTGDDTTYRGDFRQEVDFPIPFGPIKMLPFVMGRYTGYSDSPSGSRKDRLLAGTGVRVNTSFWKIDDQASSELFDIHRIRHVIEPEVSLFTSAGNVDRNELFLYDQGVDEINDISAAQIALHQRWQTKRGGPGQWRSVDFFTLNVSATFYSNQPDELGSSNFATPNGPDNGVTPSGFRGLYFPSLPEASIPRSSLAADALWRVSDTTAVLSDASWNIDDQDLATASIGVAVQRDIRLGYFIGTRYIGELNSTIATLAANYMLTTKYSIAFSQSYNLTDRQNQNSNVMIIRNFDRFMLTLSFYYDAVDETSGFEFGLFPTGLGYGVSSSQFESAMGNQQ
jgi:lipopolysaccharide assembly outer membrane protein LptD (OstA)